MPMAGTAYCNRSELYLWGAPTAAFSHIEPDDQDLGILGASAYIDSFIGDRFTLPLISFGADYKRACAIVAAYDLIWATRGANPDEDGPKDPLLIRYEQTIEWLTSIRNGGASSAVGSPLPSPVPSDGNGANVSSNVQRGWQTSSSTFGRSDAFSGRRS